MTYRVGIIGFGIMGQRMHGSMAVHDAFDVVSVYDPAAMSADVPAAASAEDVIRSPEVDLVYIACPPAYHADYATAAATAGKPVFCEKPLAVDIDQSRHLVETIREAGVANAVNFSFASSPSRAFLRTMRDTGDFGPIDGIDIRLHFATWPRGWQEDAAWLGQRAQGGYVREVLSHFIYLTESVFGTLSVDETIVRYPDGPNGSRAETHVLAHLSCGDVPVSVAGGVGGTGPDRVEFTVWGQTQSCRLDDWYTVYVSDGDAWLPAMTDIADPRQAGRVAQLDNLARFMNGDPHELPDFAAALSVQRVIERILSDG